MVGIGWRALVVVAVACGTTPPEVLTRQAELSPGPVCPYGGVLTMTGEDTDGDGVLSDDEATVLDAECDEGPDYVDDSPVMHILADPRTSLAGCAAGGREVRWGGDLDGSGTLDEDEVEGRESLCDLDGAETPADAHGFWAVAELVSPVDGCLGGAMVVEAGVGEDSTFTQVACELEPLSIDVVSGLDGDLCGPDAFGFAHGLGRSGSGDPTVSVRVDLCMRGAAPSLGDVVRSGRLAADDQVWVDQLAGTTVVRGLVLDLASVDDLSPLSGLRRVDDGLEVNCVERCGEAVLPALAEVGGVLEFYGEPSIDLPVLSPFPALREAGRVRLFTLNTVETVVEIALPALTTTSELSAGRLDSDVPRGPRSVSLPLLSSADEVSLFLNPKSSVSLPGLAAAQEVVVHAQSLSELDLGALASVPLLTLGGVSSDAAVDLANLMSVSDTLTLFEGSLTDVDAFASLVSVGKLRLEDLPALNDVSGLVGVDVGPDSWIQRCPLLCDDASSVLTDEHWWIREGVGDACE